MKKVIVFGLGRFGSQVVKTLAERGVDVLGIDKDEKITKEIDETLHIPVRNLDCSTEEGLNGIDNLENTDVFVVAIGENIEAAYNITAFLGEKFKDRTDIDIIARAGKPAQARALEKLGATKIVRLEEDAGIHVASAILGASRRYIYLGPSGDSCKIKAEKKKFVDKTLKELNFCSKFKVYVFRAVGKDGQEKAVAPSADYKVEEGDILEILGKSEDIDNFKKKFSDEITT